MLLLHLVLIQSHLSNQHRRDAMRTLLRRTPTPLLGLAVLAALGFGASSALAEARPCPLTAIGTCGNLARCQDACAAAGGDVANASCREGCCFCPGAFL
jgi:hypothetical protein